jgi:AcrR family transcriptional regulator
MDTTATSSVDKGDRRSAQRAATRARLYEEMVHEFSRRGVAETEVAGVAKRAGVSRPAFYVHFNDKDDVLRELLIVEERGIAEAARSAVGPEATVRMLFTAVVDAVLAAEERLGRLLVRDLCAAQFRPEFARLLAVEDHPLGVMMVEEVAKRATEVDPVDLAMVFLTGLFGLLATDVAEGADRRRRLDLLIELVADPDNAASPQARRKP